MEMTEQEKINGVLAEHLIVIGSKVSPTNYGEACKITNDVNKEMEVLFSEGRGPKKEEVQDMLRKLLQVRKLLSIYSGKFYEKTELWLSN